MKRSDRIASKVDAKKIYLRSGRIKKIERKKSLWKWVLDISEK